MREDLHLSIRILTKNSGSTLIAIAALALGIGATTAVFSVVNAALLRPFPHIDADRWAYLYEESPEQGLERVSVSMANFHDWKQSSRSFAAMALWMAWSYNVSGSEAEPERVRAMIITPDVFTALGLKPAAGRLLQLSDDPLNPDRPVMISHSLWQRRFGGDPSIAGKKIELNLVPHTVVGVAPRGFSFPPDSNTDVWAPYSWQTIASSKARDARGFGAAAMLRDGVTFETAQAELNVIAARLAATYREDQGFGARAVPVRESITGEFRTPLLALLGSLSLVVLLVCVNIANLQLVKVEARNREFAIRAALGGARWRLIRQLLMESALLALIAGCLGLLLAPVCARLLLAFVPTQRIPWLDVPMDQNVLLACAALTLAVTMVSGLAPAFRGVRLDLSSMLTRGGSAATSAAGSRRLRHLFLIAQLAFSLMLLVGAALLIQSLIRLQRVNPGFTAENRMTLSFSAPRARYRDGEKIALLGARVRDEVAQMPGVRAAGIAQALPFAESVMWFQAVTRQNPNAVPNLAALPHVHYNVVSAGYGEALGLPLKAGRMLSASDARNSEPVVVINQALANQHFRGENPIGQKMWIGHAQALPQMPPRTVVGVVGDALWRSLERPPEPEAWVPLTQQEMGEDIFRTLFLVVHTDGDPAARIADLRERIRTVDKDLALTSVRTLQSRLDESVWRQRLVATTMGALSVAALVIALLGVFGVISYLVNRRSHEMGVRIALGASPREIMRLIMTECGFLVLAGLAVGAGGAYWLSRYLSSLLFGVTSLDAPSFIGSALLLAIAAMAACGLPARRAARVDPMVTLRAD